MFCSGVRKFCSWARNSFAHPADGRAQTVLVLSLGRAGREIQEIAEELFGGLPPIFHHQGDGLLLLFGEGQLRGREHAGYLLLQLGERIFSGQGSALGEQGGGKEQERNEDVFQHAASMMPDSRAR